MSLTHSRRSTLVLLALAAGLLLSLISPLPASAASAKTTKIAGWKTTTLTFPLHGTWKSSVTVGGPARRVVWLQYRKGAHWVTVAAAKTSTKHVAAFSRKLTGAGTFSYRLLVPAVKGWKAAATKSRAVKVVKPVPHPAAPLHLSGGFTGKYQLGGGTGTQNAPFYLEWSGGGVVFTHTGVDRDFGIDQYAMTSMNTLQWSVTMSPSAPNPSGCTFAGSGTIIGSTAFMLATFHGQGTIDLVPARADSAGRHLVSFSISTVSSHLPWPVMTMTQTCPNVPPVNDDIAGSLFKNALGSLMTTSDQHGTLRLANPYSITGSGWSADPFLYPGEARYSSYAFAG